MARRRDEGRQLGIRRKVRRVHLPGGPDARLPQGVEANVGPGLREHCTGIRVRRLLGLPSQGEVLEVGGPGLAQADQGEPDPERVQAARQRDAAHRGRVRPEEEALRRRGDRVRRHQAKPRVHEVHAKGPREGDARVEIGRHGAQHTEALPRGIQKGEADSGGYGVRAVPLLFSPRNKARRHRILGIRKGAAPKLLLIQPLLLLVTTPVTIALDMMVESIQTIRRRR